MVEASGSTPRRARSASAPIHVHETPVQIKNIAFRQGDATPGSLKRSVKRSSVKGSGRRGSSIGGGFEGMRDSRHHRELRLANLLTYFFPHWQLCLTLKSQITYCTGPLMGANLLHGDYAASCLGQPKDNGIESSSLRKAHPPHHKPSPDRSSILLLPIFVTRA